jgi:Putative zinc-finger
MTCQMMMSLGVYVLDAADARERARVEAHLPGCPACRAELTRLRPLPGLLARVPDDMLAAGGPAGQPTRAKTGGRLGRPWRAVAIAASVAAVAAAAGGLWLTPQDAGQRPATITLTAANPATDVTATAALTATSWGTSIRLRLRGLPLNVQCRLIVRSRAGATEMSGVWDAWRGGPISVPASTAWRPADIASLQITTADESLLTISTGHKPAAAGVTPASGRTP